MQPETVKKYNVFLLGVCFCLVFTGFNTVGGIQTLIFDSAENPDSGGYVDGFHGNGLTSLAIVYAVFTLGNWIAPSVVAWLGPRITMMIGGSVYALFIAQLLILNTVLLYLASALLGLGAAIIWTAQGNFLTLNSDENTMSRNSGIFWAMQISSNFFGNIFVFFLFQDEKYIDKETRNLVGIVFLAVTGVGILLMLLLKPAPVAGGPGAEVAGPPESPLTALKSSINLFLTKKMLLLCVTFFYTGLQLNIWSAVYGTSIGFTHAFGDNAKSLATISGIFVAIGEVLGGGVFGIFGHLTVKRGRDPIVMLGFVLSMAAYFLIFLNIPNEAPLGETTEWEVAFIESNQYLAIFTSFLLGFSDACFNTQVFSILGSAFKDNSSSAFAIFKFMQSGSSAIAFGYSPYLQLYWQLLIVVIFDVAGTVAFCYVEWSARRLEANTQTSSNEVLSETETGSNPQLGED